MKNSSSISCFIRYLLVVISFLAISSNLYSFYYEHNVKEDLRITETEKGADDEQDNTKEPRYVAYEAVVPVVHFNVVFQLFSFVKIEIAEVPTQIVKHSPPALFTRSFYKTLFRMIISPNAP